MKNTIRGLLLIAIFMMALAPFMYEKESVTTTSEVIIKTKEVAKVKEVVVEQPLHDVDLPDFAKISDTKRKKQLFFDFLKPAIDKENRRLRALRGKLLALENNVLQTIPLSGDELDWLQLIARSYSIDSELSSKDKLARLLNKVDEIPRELVLVQAANESAWGTSRFARIGLNFFGLWCFKKGCGLVPQGRDTGLNHEVAAFEGIDSMVSYYFKNINSHRAYRLFRQIRKQLRDNDLPLEPSILATGLLPYSERGMTYIVELNNMMRHNHKYIKA
ncbi:glucosaminidase domain-containing protein [Thalassomonas sp. M1454]|uniref:glucosaminidase domain-containing protein n=1 Tax=Thalassomonas sp. M1454 TaxID=2594477 RepID=UPI0011803672|nr:glucosaminidase domain-containing protein [Thalassomonas sp. M1454]TRX56968.1 glucosaminidase [Thalassomonas sp. M1454]